MSTPSIDLTSQLPQDNNGSYPAAWRPLHVVMVDEELPFPPTSGKRIRTLNLTMRLAQRHHITYVCHRNQDPVEANEAVTYFADHGITPVVVDRVVPPRAGLGFYARLAANLLSPLPYSVASHQSKALRQAVRDVASAQPVDLWHCEWTPYARALSPEIEGPRIVMAHNVESVIWQRYYQNERHPLRRWYIRQQYLKYRRFEREALAGMSTTVAVSDLDADRFRSDLAVPRVDVVENGVDIDYFHPTNQPRNPARLVFIGSLDWRPNLDGLRTFLERVYPALVQAQPAVRFAIVGRNPPQWLRGLASALPGVELHANVPDVRPYLAEAGVMVTPLRIGGGSRLKILEALATGTPVVSTRIGAEGLHLTPGADLTVVEEMDDLGDALLTAIGEPERMQAQALCGREQVLRRYSWDRLSNQLEQIWIDCVAHHQNPPVGLPLSSESIGASRQTSIRQDDLQRGGHAA